MGTHRTYTFLVTVGWDSNDQAVYPSGVPASGPIVDPDRCMRAKNRNVTWGSVRVREALVIRAMPDRLAALYLDYRGWPELFPATIRGVRWLEEHDGDITIEVDHRTEGRVVNIIRPMSASVI